MKPVYGGNLGSILTINVGSSSLKFAVFRGGELLGSGLIERLGTPDCTWTAHMGAEQQSGALPNNSPSEILSLLERIFPGKSFAAIAHRVVHGGEKFRDHCIVNPEVLNSLKDLKPLAPEHLPCEIRFMEATCSHFKVTPSIACFDTVFHVKIPEVARTYALPRSVRQLGARRYGFHGLSYASLVRVLKERGECQGRSVLAHLGNGASMAAVLDGAGLDTTMGFTPAAGLVMGTRCGDIDPGIFRFIAGQFGLDATAIDHLLNHESGLAGLSGIGGDIRDLLHAAKTNHEAALALEVFCHVAKKHAAGMTASLGGIDRLVFTGGIGQHAVGIRATICEGLAFLGIRLDATANDKSSSKISAADSPVDVLVIPADEEGEMVRIATWLMNFSEPNQHPTPS